MNHDVYISTIRVFNRLSSEFLLEKLLEQRDSYLYTLKHIEFQLVTDPSTEEKENIEKLQTTAIDQLKKIEQEIAFISSKKSS